MRTGMNKPALASPARRSPAGIETVGRGDRQQADVAAILSHKSDRLNCFWRDRPGVGHDELAVRTGRAQPISAVHDGLPQRWRHFTLDLLDRPCRKPQINRTAGLVAQPVAL